MSTIISLFDLLLKIAGLVFAGFFAFTLFFGIGVFAGFFVFTLFFGIGVFASLAVNGLPWWGIVLGSVGGVIILAAMAARDGGGKK